MKEIIKFIAEIVNIIHDFLMSTTDSMGFNFTDKDLHFWVIGIIGTIIFISTQILFRVLSKWSITSISFIYTITILTVIVFSIEIQQKITGRGNMEFEDAVIGLFGFLFFFMLYLIIKFVVLFINRFIKKHK